MPDLTIKLVRHWSARTDPVVVAAAGIGIILAFLALYPTAMLFYGSVSDAPLGVPGHLTLAHYRAAYGDPNTYRMIGNSFVFAAGAAAISLVVAGVLRPGFVPPGRRRPAPPPLVV